MIEPTNSLSRTASWVIIDQWTGQVVMETYLADVAKNLRPRFKAVPILEYLQSLNRGQS